MLGIIGLGIASAAMRRSVAPAAFFAATGGTTGTSGGYTRHTFTASGTFQITSGSATVFWEIVGGGGAGGTSAAAGGGGGGGGGAIERGSAVLGAGTYAVTIGAGGVASTPTLHPTSGGTSSFNGVSALGGGRGGAGDGTTNIPGAQGGSGGGGRGITTGGDTSAGAASGSNANAGGAGVASATGSQRYGGGGGGAGGAGTASSTTTAGVGGAGQASQAPGVSATYSGGGGGGSNTTAGLGGHGGDTSATGGRGASGMTASGTPGPAQAGKTPGSGGGGGPQVGTGSPVTNGGAGAAGIVHVWYVSTPGAFGDSQWSMAAGPGAGQATITLAALPISPNGAAITATQYRVNGGTATSLGLTAAGSATISGLGNGATPNVEIRASNASGAGAWSSVKTVTTYTAPANTVAPSISGGTTQGATLTAAAGTWTGTPTPSIAGQWRVNGADVPGATSSTFSTSSLAVGDVVTYRETATNVVSAVSATSSGVTLTAPDAAPVNTVLPAISGDDTVGSTLTATAGTWTGSPTPTYAYQWRANGSNVSGATSSTFATTLLSAGDVVTCRVTATNIAGSASATSSGVTLTADTGPTEIPDAIILSGRSSEMVAPEGITFSPDLALVGAHFGISAPGGVYDARMHDVYYVWSFGEAGSFAAPQHLLPEHMDRNRAIGPAVAHVYRTPGTYTARLDMYGTIGGAPAHAYSERTVTVGSSASMFAGAQTYFVSPSSDWTNAPSGSQHVTSLDNAAEWANEGGGPYRIMLNRGETHTWGGRRFGFNTAAACTIHVVAGPGGGAKPILTCTGVFGCGGFDDATYVNKALVVQGLVMNGPYDPITPGEPEVTGAFSSFGSYAPQQMLIDDCEIRNFGNFLYIGDDTSRHIYMHDNIMEGYGQAGVTGAHADGLILLGNRILSAAGAPIDNSVNMGATVRTGAEIMTFISHANDIECAQGWSGLGGGYIAVQPCIRVESDGVAGQTINITNCTFAGGFTQLSIANGDDPSVILNAIIDGCYFLGSYQSGNVIGAENAGTTVRNNIAVIPNPATRIGPGLSSFVVLINVGGGASLVPPMKVYGNTIVNLTSDTLGVVANNGGYSNVTTQNNVIHQPAASPAQTADAPLVTTPALWTPREMGYMDRATPRITASATPSGTPAAYSLDTGSDAIGDATTGLIPPFNIIGDERADPPNRGAW